MSVTLPLLAPSSAETTALILANGPSLAGVDLTRLPPAATFGMNAAYRHWERIGWYPDHYACLDLVVGLSHAEAIGAMIARSGPPHLFLLRANLIERLGLAAETKVIDYDALAGREPILARTPVTTGSHCLIWAMALGFRRLFLLGADCDYVEIVPGAERLGGNELRIAAEAENPNYYFADYQRVGDRYQIPNADGATHLRAWRAAACVAAMLEAEVYNLSPRSRVDAFAFAARDAFLAGAPVPVLQRPLRRDAPPLGRPVPTARLGAWP